MVEIKAPTKKFEWPTKKVKIPGEWSNKNGNSN